MDATDLPLAERLKAAHHGAPIESQPLPAVLAPGAVSPTRVTVYVPAAA